MGKYLPARIRLTDGTARLESVCFPWEYTDATFTPVYWDGQGGPGHFRQPSPQESLIDLPPLSVTDVSEDAETQNDMETDITDG